MMRVSLNFSVSDIGNISQTINPRPASMYLQRVSSWDSGDKQVARLPENFARQCTCFCQKSGPFDSEVQSIWRMLIAHIHESLY